MSNSKVSHKIKKRENPNDKFYTPLNLVKTHLELMKPFIKDGDVIYEPFYGTGNYYNSYKDYFPNNTYEYSEIDMGLDFFDFNKKIDAIITNPPYSIIDKVLEKCVELNPHSISLLIGINNLTAKRIEYMNKHGYSLCLYHICKVFKWYGMSVIITFSKDKNQIISYDRVVYK